MSHVDLLVTQSLGPAGPGLRGEGDDRAVAAAAARLHGGQVNVVIPLPEGLLVLVVPVDQIKVPSSGPGPSPPVSLLVLRASVLSIRPDPRVS